MRVTELIVLILEGYGVAGLIFAAAFVSTGINRLDPAAAGAGFAFRALIFPGAAALWPLLLRRWHAGVPKV